MKKLFFAAAFLLTASVAVNAQTEKTTPDTPSPTTTATAPSPSQPKQFKTIDRNTVAPSALEKIGTKYGGYSILEAYQSTDGEYKLVVSKDSKKNTAYFSSNGEFIREE